MKTTKAPVGTVGVPVQIRTGCLPNTSRNDTARVAWHGADILVLLWRQAIGYEDSDRLACDSV
jgi:hypothetical protein